MEGAHTLPEGYWFVTALQSADDGDDAGMSRLLLESWGSHQHHNEAIVPSTIAPTSPLAATICNEDEEELDENLPVVDLHAALVRAFGVL